MKNNTKSRANKTIHPGGRRYERIEMFCSWVDEVRDYFEKDVAKIMIREFQRAKLTRDIRMIQSFTNPGNYCVYCLIK